MAINVQRIIGYGDDWTSVVSLCVNNNKSFVSYNKGITLLELASCKSQVDYKGQNARCIVAPFQRGIPLTDQEEVSVFKIDEFRNLLEPKLKKVKMFPSWNASSSNQLVFVLSWLRCIYLQRSIKLVENNHASFRNSEIQSTLESFAILSLCIRKGDLLHQELYHRLQKRRRNANKYSLSMKSQFALYWNALRWHWMDLKARFLLKMWGRSICYTRDWTEWIHCFPRFILMPLTS